ncbi:HORMA domain-containing protein 2 isoform X2 [Aplysia californica]|uniref:HORMA domain-containing protein 2 isoform X2 n=1 Tax=Aplysia californica TaxID=6500 RepID=A0ABM1VX85_APLCA|nr:HORMA domain-containing protein 2 isoform X2 [Aplysia californica]
MATLQAQRPQVKNWETIFPNEQVTEQRSALFVKKLLAVAISNITYLRNIFPEHAFGDKYLEDLNLKILRNESMCPGACQVIKWVKGCFDALDKKYLKSLVIGIYVDPNNPETVIESYTFKFSYQNSGAVDIYRNDRKISCAYSADETKKATIRLLRTLIVLTNTLTSLPDKVMMTMKLFYYDEVTPADYEPPGFKPSSDDAFVFQDDATNIAIGSVSTAFHTVKLRVKTDAKQFDMHEEPISNSQDDSTNICVTDAGLDKEGTDSVQEVTCEQAAKISKPVHIAEKHSNKKSIQQASPDVPEVNQEDFKVRCPCGCNEDDGLMILCAECKFWQHGVCFLIISEENAPESHICDICAKPGNPLLEPTDPQLCEMTSITVQGTCLWRRALTVCTEFKKIVAPQLARRLGIENAVAQGLINRLEKEGYIANSHQRKKLGKMVNQEEIKSKGIPHYFRTPQALSQKQTSVSEDTENCMAVNALSECAKKMSLDSTEQITHSPPAQAKAATRPMQNKRPFTRSRKRARSQTNDNDFEIACSGDSPTAGSKSKKKASKVSRDVVV